MDYCTQTKQDCKLRPPASHRTCQKFKGRGLGFALREHSPASNPREILQGPSPEGLFWSPERGGTLALPKPERLLVQRCNFRPDTRFNKTNFKTSALQLPPPLSSASQVTPFSGPQPNPHPGLTALTVESALLPQSPPAPGVPCVSSLVRMREQTLLRCGEAGRERGWARPQRTAGS